MCHARNIGEVSYSNIKCIKFMVVWIINEKI